MDVTHEQDVAPRERRPALPRVDAFDLPSAEGRVRQEGHRRQEFPPPAEGQLPDDAGDEALRPVLVRYHPFQVRGLPVEPAGGLDHLGPLIGHVKGEPLRKAALYPNLKCVIRRVAVVGGAGHPRELRVNRRGEQVGARDCCAGEARSRQQGIERVLHLRAEVIDGRLIAHRRAA